MKPAIFHPAAREVIRSFPVEVRRSGAAELRIRDRAGIYRVFYYVKSARGVLVFHAFVKKGRATSLRELNIGRKRLKELLYEEN